MMPKPGRGDVRLESPVAPRPLGRERGDRSGNRRGSEAPEIAVERVPADLRHVGRDRDDRVGVAGRADDPAEHDALGPGCERETVPQLARLDVRVDPAGAADHNRRILKVPRAARGRTGAERVEDLKIDLPVAVRIRRGGVPEIDVPVGREASGEAVPGRDRPQNHAARRGQRDRDLIRRSIPRPDDDEIVFVPRPGRVGRHQHRHVLARRGRHGHLGMDVVGPLVSRRGHHDPARPGELIDELIHEEGAVVRALLRSEAQVHDRRLAAGGRHLKDVVDAIHDSRHGQIGLHDADVGFRRHSDERVRSLSMTRGASVSGRDPEHMGSMSEIVHFVDLARVDLRPGPFRAVGEPRRRRAGDVSDPTGKRSGSTRPSG